MKHGSLFSGIGGFDLAAEWMGWENIFHCEWMPFPRQILKYYWPNSISYENICTTDFTIHRGKIDLISGGFPCQPYSTAGKRKGKEDERHLWPEMLRAIREIKPRWVVGENVRGLVSWSDGLVFEEVQSDLEAEGYEVQPFLLPACGLNAPHRRDRIWFVAHSLCERYSRSTSTRIEENERRIIHNENRKHTGENKKTDWNNWPNQPYVLLRDNGFPGGLDNKTFSTIRRESIKGAGNAIVPQVALQIFKAIEEYELRLNPSIVL